MIYTPHHIKENAHTLRYNDQLDMYITWHVPMEHGFAMVETQPHCKIDFICQHRCGAQKHVGCPVATQLEADL